MRAIAPRAHGIWKQPLHPANWSGVSGASEAPKSTVRPLIAAIPAPEPDGESFCHRDMSGDTNELPAPTSWSPLAPAPAEAAAIADTAASTARLAANTILFIPVFSLVEMGRVSRWVGPSLTRRRLRVG